MIYFDNSATTKPADAVLESYQKAASLFFANPSSLHRFGQKAHDLQEQARKQTAQLMGALPEELIFTSGGTESNNLAIKGIAYQYQNRGRHCITSAVEHPSVREAMKQLEAEGFSVTYLPVDAEGRVSLTDLKQAILKETILVSLMHVNNEVGTIQPIAEIADYLADFPQIAFHVDAVQGIGKESLDLRHVDLLSVSGHKLHGLRGTGLLYKKKNWQLAPLFSGGGQEQNWRSGTENTAGIVAFAKALRLEIAEMNEKKAKMQEIQSFLRTKLQNLPGVIVHTPENGAAPHILCLSAASGGRGEVLVHALEEADIYVSTTSACSSRSKLESSTLHAMKVPEKEAVSAIRISLGYQNQLAEAEIFVDTFQEVLKKLNEVVN
ncbi:cysteine desulfurase family protein [Listeria costaricensis]|uniref:cysteine desulfurase family protein n=1 Tax=Listeria costaricensis TaxID=2026604 RepID=UPI000C0866CA|nr:cysteine desulfurase family protein [Listeria costaricensis]